MNVKNLLDFDILIVFVEEIGFDVECFEIIFNSESIIEKLNEEMYMVCSIGV